MTPLTTARLVLLLAGIALFVYALRTGLAWPRTVAIGLLVMAMLIGFYDRWQRRQRE